MLLYKKKYIGFLIYYVICRMYDMIKFLNEIIFEWFVEYMIWWYLNDIIIKCVLLCLIYSIYISYV